LSQLVIFPIYFLGGLNSSYCSMDLCVFYETDYRPTTEWEQVKLPDEKEKVASDIAGLSILENKKYLHLLDELIADERLRR